jgi:hypothetical protein
MPGPVFQGRCVLEIEVPQKTICQNECERCKRVWYSDAEAPTAKVIVRMFQHGAAAPVIDASYDVLCDGCTQTVGNLLRSLARDMKKLGSAKPRAKKEGASALPKREPGTTGPDASPARTLAEAAPLPSLSVPSKRA